MEESSWEWGIDNRSETFPITPKEAPPQEQADNLGECNCDNGVEIDVLFIFTVEVFLFFYCSRVGDHSSIV
jgi:hypothetical protein